MLCNVSVCLGWTTFSRILSLVCSWLRCATREILGRFARKKGSSSYCSWCPLSLICWFTCCCEVAAGLAISSPSPGSSFNFPDLGQVCVYLFNWGLKLLQDAPNTKVGGNKNKGFSDPCGFPTHACEFQAASWSSLPDCLHSGLQAPTSEKEITALQSLLNQLPQFPESPERLIHIQPLTLYSDSTAAQWRKNGLSINSAGQLEIHFEKKPHLIYTSYNIQM